MYYVEQFLTMTNATVEYAQMPNTRYTPDQNKSSVFNVFCIA